MYSKTEAAYKILKESKKPLHVADISAISEPGSDKLTTWWVIKSLVTWFISSLVLMLVLSVILLILNKLVPYIIFLIFLRT